MKVLSDNTADRLLRHLDAAEGGITPRRIPRGASTTPPAPMWQIHVTAAGAVTVDGGDVYANGTRYTLEPADLGTASEASLVVWHDGEDGGEITLESSSWEPDDGEAYRIIGEVRQGDATSPWYSRQLVHGPIEADGNHFGSADDAESRTEWEQTEEVPAILDLDGATRFKILVDSRGNIVSWTSGEEGEEPEDPENPREPAPPCGNPLNDSDDSNPLDRPEGAGGGGGGGNAQEDHNPLDYEGDGGFTPTCGGEAA